MLLLATVKELRRIVQERVESTLLRAVRVILLPSPDSLFKVRAEKEVVVQPAQGLVVFEFSVALQMQMSCRWCNFQLGDKERDRALVLRILEQVRVLDQLNVGEDVASESDSPA